MAYTLPLVGRTDEAKTHIAALRKMKPGFTIRDAVVFYKAGCFELAFRDKMGDALRQAGLPE